MQAVKTVEIGFDPVHITGAVAMGGTLIYLLSEYKTKYPIELIILGVAMVAYLILSSVPKPFWLRVRYFDWFVTVPLLVYVVAQFGNVPYWAIGGAAALMLGAGFLAVLGRKVDYNKFIALGFVFYAIFFALLAFSGNTLPWWIIYPFFLSWGLYGLVDRLEGPKDHWAYTVLDVVNKPLFIILLLRHLETL
jgi:bacteriorhodopsin